MRKRYRFLVLKPGHFHAALVFKDVDHRILDDVDVVVTDSQDALPFIDLIDRFNCRDIQSTDWKVKVHERENLAFDTGSPPEDCVVVVSGRNASKLESVAKLCSQGYNVLVDKPVLTHANQMSAIDSLFEGPGEVMELMTARHQMLSRLCQAIANRQSLFGEMVDDGDPAITLSSTHHLCKMVDGESLIRPAWYYDVGVQGNGLVDIQNHMVEQALWFVLGENEVNEETEIQLDAVRSWSTAVPPELFKQSTELERYPADLEKYLDDDGVLQLECNSEIDWRINGVRVRSRAEWKQIEPEDGGDIHTITLRGSRCNVEAVQSPESDFFPWVDLTAADDDARSALSEALQQCCDEWAEDIFPRIGFSELRAGFHMLIPRALDRGHESHFGLVREQFLDFLDGEGVPEAANRRARLRYRLLGEAHAMGAATSGCNSD